MRTRTVRFLYKKEILDVLRDKKTVLMMLVVPLVLYPIIFIVGLQLMTSVTRTINTQEYAVSLLFEPDETLAEVLADDSDRDYVLRLVESADPAKDLVSERICAYVTREIKDGVPVFQIHYLSSVSNSNYAVDRIEALLAKYRTKLSERMIEDAGLSAKKVLSPISVAYDDRSTGEETAGSLLGIIIPFMLVMSLLLGTMYPAIDTTAGERERGTLETMLTLPVTNRELIVSKFLTVATIGVVSAVLNVISMGFVGFYLYKVAAKTGSIKGDVSVARFLPAAAVGVLCILAFAVFISAITMCVTAFASSYKEANNYITPLTLVVMFGSFAGFLPNVVLTKNVALIPVVNICLLVRDLLAFKYSVGIIAIVLVSNVIYGLFAVMLLAKIYNSESVLFGNGKGSIQIFERRSNMKPGGIPTTGDAWFVLAITALLMIYIGGSLQASYGMAGIVATQLIILLVPLLVAVYTRKSLRKTFSLRRMPFRGLPAAILMSIGAIFVGAVLSTLVSLLFPASAMSAEDSLSDLFNGSFLPTLLMIAVLPAVCEEVLFRGYIFTAMAGRFKPVAAMIVTSVMFGIYHMSVVRFFTTALLGFFSAYVVYRTGSIFCGMLMHVINNSIAVVLEMKPELLKPILPFLMSEDLRICLILAPVGCLLLAAGMLVLGRTREKGQTDIHEN